MRVPLRADFDAVGVRALARKSGAARKRGDCWRWLRSMTGRPGRKPPRSPGLRSRSFVIGSSSSTLRGREG